MAKTKKGASPLSVTPWFPANVRPVRAGMYECEICIKHSNPQKQHYWTGKAWYMARNDFVGGLAPFRWRGLSSPFTTPQPLREE